MKRKEVLLDKEKVNILWLRELSDMEMKKLRTQQLYVGHTCPGTSDHFQFSFAPLYFSNASVREELDPLLCVDYDMIGEEMQDLLALKCHSYTQVSFGCYVENTKVYCRNVGLQKVKKKRY